jgi:hypothetical protein
MSFRSALLGKGAVGLVVAFIAVGGGSVAAMAATGSHSPGELAQNVAQIVEGCKDKVRVGDTHGIGECVSDQVNHGKNGEAHQQANGVQDADEHKDTGSDTSSKHQDHGQGSGTGSNGAPGQGGSGNHGHEPSPKTHQ